VNVIGFPVVRIEKKDWLESCFGICQDEVPLLRQPIPDFESLPFEARDKLLQVYVTKDEVLQVLAKHVSFFLVKKRDGVIGWLQEQGLRENQKIKAFPILSSKLQRSADFLKEWLGTPYRWGGVSKSGIDCSAFTQAYFFDVLNAEIPKNSQDQRKLGSSITISEIQDNDLLFCHRQGYQNINHVAIFYEGNVYHSQLNRGVVADDLNAFTQKHVIQEIKRISPFSLNKVTT
jgi:probable lipoprotein NlpC